MGLFDKIKDNAKTISMKALEGTREYEDYYEGPAPAPKVTKTATPRQAEASKPKEAPAVEGKPTKTSGETVVVSPSVSSEAKREEKKPEIESVAKTTEADKTEKAEIEKEDSETPAKSSAVKKEPVEEPKKEEPKPATRKSKITEVSKAEIEKSKAKTAAKERLAKSYIPSYKKLASKENNESGEPVGVRKSKSNINIVDVAPKNYVPPAQRSLYARERAALSAIASQRKLNGTVPLYSTAHMSFKTRVFIDRIEYSGSFGKTTVPIDQVAWVKLRASGTGIIIETNESKKIVMVVKPADRLSFADAVMRTQLLQPKKSRFKDTKTIRIDQLDQFNEGVDEIEKLARLHDKGILTQEEFETKKKQILGI